MLRKVIVSLVLIVCFLAMAGVIAAHLVASRPEAETFERQESVLLVEAIELEPRTLVEEITGYGTARADRYARLSAQVAGEIVELPDSVKPGAAIEKDGLLLRIDETDYTRNLERAQGLLAQARAQLEQLDVQEKNLKRLMATARRQVDSAKWDYDKVQKLFEAGTAPKREREQARFLYEQSNLALQRLENERALLPTGRTQLRAVCDTHEVEVKIGQRNVDRCRITAPFDGRVDQVKVELGERVQPGLVLLSVVDPRLIEVPVELPISVRDRVRVGAACTLSVDSIPGVSWEGKVTRASPTASELTRTFELYVEIDNAGRAAPLVPGYFVLAKIVGATIPDALVVPRVAIRQGRVFVCESGVASERTVRVERQLGDRSVVAGLAAGQMVITTNLDTLYEGMPVRLAGATTGPASRMAAK